MTVASTAGGRGPPDVACAFRPMRLSCYARVCRYTIYAQFQRDG